MARVIRIMREIGPRRAAAALRERLWSDSVAFGLASSLEDLPEPRPPKVPVEMTALDAAAFRGFHDELARADDPDDRLELDQRIRLCAAGARQLYVALSADGAPIYAQWLFTPGSETTLQTVTPRQFPTLAPGESLVEAAYTFVDFRKMGAMAAGMSRLLHIARDGGSNRCLTYVSADNVPSLRGCANVGFGLDHVRETRQRLGRRSMRFRPPDDRDRAVWAQAVAPR